MEASFGSVFLLLLLVLDPMGNVPLCTALLRRVESPRRRRMILLRECAVALGVLLAALWFGDDFLGLLGLSEPSVGIAGGIVLFLISLRMIFEHPEKVFGGLPTEEEPFIVPMAVPFLAGPSAFATLLLLSAQELPGRNQVALALVAAMTLSALIFMASDTLIRWVGERGLDALQRLMGLVLTAMAVEMFLRGIRQFLDAAPVS